MHIVPANSPYADMFTRPGLEQSWEFLTQLVFKGKTDFDTMWWGHLMQYAYVYNGIMYIYILKLRAIKRERKMTRFPSAPKKENTFKKSNGNLSSKRQNILKSAPIPLTLIFYVLFAGVFSSNLWGISCNI